MKNFRIIFGCSLIVGVAATGISAQNYKIKQTTSMMGQDMSSTVYVKGSRKRTESSGMMGMGGDVADIEQCDLKRDIKLSDKKKQYFIAPFATNAGDTNSPTGRQSPPPAGKVTGRVTKGGTLTMTSSINDTGERKQMFGLTARHIKTSMKMESSPDACSASNVQMETDGWYVDLPSFSCPFSMSGSSMPYQRPEKSGCQDRIVIKENGGGKLGFPLQVTTMMNGEGSFTQSLETVEFSKATLEDALFDVPSGYSLVNNEQDLYGRPDMAAMMRAAQDGDNDDKPKSSGRKATPPPMPGMTTNAPKRAGVKRIGVLVPTNAAGESISTANMQSYLVQQLTNGNVEAIAVGSESDAKAAGCDYTLSSDFSKLKQSAASKVGGMFGKITSIDTSGGRSWDVQIDYLLIAMPDGKSATKSKAVLKASGDVDRAAESALAMEAAAILAAVR